MTEDTRPPEDDWSPDGTDDQEGAGPWSWLDEAVGAWDHLDAGDDASVPARFGPPDDTGPPDDEGPDAEAPGQPPAAAQPVAGDGAPGPVDLGFPDDDSPAGGDVPDATFDEEDSDSFAAITPDDTAGTCSTTALAEALTLAGVEDPGMILSAFDGEQVDARHAVGALDFAGVDARIEHTGLGELVERLAAGDEVLLGGGPPHALVGIDPAAAEVVVEPLAGGPRTVIAIELFEDAWDQAANELMVVNGDNPGIRLGAGEVCVLPVAVGDML